MENNLQPSDLRLTDLKSAFGQKTGENEFLTVLGVIVMIYPSYWYRSIAFLMSYQVVDIWPRLGAVDHVVNRG